MTEIETLLLESVRELERTHSEEMKTLGRLVSGLSERLNESEAARADLSKQVQSLSKQVSSLSEQVRQLSD